MPRLLSISLPKAASAEQTTRALKLIVRLFNKKQKAPCRCPGLWRIPSGPCAPRDAQAVKRSRKFLQEGVAGGRRDPLQTHLSLNGLLFWWRTTGGGGPAATKPLYSLRSWALSQTASLTWGCSCRRHETPWNLIMEFRMHCWSWMSHSRKLVVNPSCVVILTHRSVDPLLQMESQFTPTV